MSPMGLFGSDDGKSRQEKREEREMRGGFTPTDSLGGQKGNVKRVIDEEAGVVIYGRAWHPSPSVHGYGLTAVPIEDTDLEIDDSSSDDS